MVFFFPFYFLFEPLLQSSRGGRKISIYLTAQGVAGTQGPWGASEVRLPGVVMASLLPILVPRPGQLWEDSVPSPQLHPCLSDSSLWLPPLSQLVHLLRNPPASTLPFSHEILLFQTSILILELDFELSKQGNQLLYCLSFPFMEPLPWSSPCPGTASLPDCNGRAEMAGSTQRTEALVHSSVPLQSSCVFFGKTRKLTWRH